ncbi:MAG: hypothetical protein WHS82_03695 [Candidatus Methanosuratincola sp.]
MPRVPIEVVLFKTENCAGCLAAEKIISSIIMELNSDQETIRLINYDVDTEEGFREAQKRGVEATPAIFVSGERYEGKVGEEFFEFLRERLGDKGRAESGRIGYGSGEER